MIGRRILLITLLLLPCAALAGCAAPARDPRVLLPEEESLPPLRVEAAKPVWNRAGLLRAEIRLATPDPREEHILVRVVFLDGDGTPLPGDPPWVNVIVPAMGSHLHERIAARTSAVDYRVELRRGAGR
ncbi:MAG: hypothetical protein ACO4CW_05795 [Planctomycetota bacterium]